MNKLYRFFYKTTRDGMPQYVYIADSSYEACWERFKLWLKELSGFTPNGSLRFYDASRRGEADLLGEVDCAPFIAGGLEGIRVRWM